MNRTYINCGTSREAVRVAMATYEAVGARAFSDVTIKAIHKSQNEGKAMSVACDHGGDMTYSQTSYFRDSGWKSIGDFSEMKPVFKVVEIRLNATYLAKIHENYVTVNSCSER